MASPTKQQPKVLIPPTKRQTMVGGLGGKPGGATAPDRSSPPNWMSATGAPQGGQGQNLSPTPKIPKAPKMGSTVPTDTGKTKFRNANVDFQVDRITQKDSPLMKRARANGEAFANARGLLNSTLAGQAGEDAVYKHVMEMAKQNAGQIHDRNISLQNFEQDSRLSDQRFVQDSRLSDRNFAQNSSLSRQGFEQQAELNQQTFGHQQTLQQQELANRTEIAQLDNETRREIAVVDANTRLEINEATLNAQERAETSRLLQEADRTYQQAVANITANPDLPASVRTQQLNNARQVWSTSRQMVAKMYGVTLKWPNSNASSTGTSAGTNTAATGTTTTPNAQTIASTYARTGLGGGGAAGIRARNN